MNKKTKFKNQIVSILSVAALAVSTTGVLSNAEAEDLSIIGTIKAVGAENSPVDVVVVQKDNGYIAYEGKAENGEICVPKILDGEYTVMIGKTYFASKSYDVTVGAETVEINDEISRYGDLNSDGKITTVDVGIVNANAKGVSSLEEYKFKLGDVNLDDKITTVDVGMVNAHAKGIKNLSTIDPNEILPTEPTEEPTDEPTSEPTSDETSKPTEEPTTEPTTAKPGTVPTQRPNVGIIKLESVKKNNTTATIDYENAKNGYGAKIWIGEAYGNGNNPAGSGQVPVPVKVEGFDVLTAKNEKIDDTSFGLTGLRPNKTYYYVIQPFARYYAAYCSYCHEEIDYGATVCQNCGLDIYEKWEDEFGSGVTAWIENGVTKYSDLRIVVSWGTRYYDMFTTTDNGTIKIEKTMKEKYQAITDEALPKLKLWKSKYPTSDAELSKTVTVNGEEISYYPQTPFAPSEDSVYYDDYRNTLDEYISQYDERDSVTFSNNVASGSIVWSDEEAALKPLSELQITFQPRTYCSSWIVDCFNDDGTLKTYLDAYADPIGYNGNRHGSPWTGMVDFVGDVGYIGKTWINENITSDMTTQQKIEKINEYTIELMNQPENDNYHYLGDLPVLPFKPGPCCRDHRLYGISADGTYSAENLCSSVFTHESIGTDAYSYDLIFRSLCYAANVKIYNSGIGTFFIIENGERYYTCPLLNAHYQLSLFGVNDINQFTNVAGADIDYLNDAIDTLNEYYRPIWVAIDAKHDENSSNRNSYRINGYNFNYNGETIAKIDMYGITGCVVTVIDSNTECMECYLGC